MILQYVDNSGLGRHADHAQPGLSYSRSDVVRSGQVPAVFATVVYALPPVVRLTNLGIRRVSMDIQEAALAFGASTWQMLKEVRLPLAMPSILAGINQTTMLALSMVVIASMIGAGGLGEEVLGLPTVAAGKALKPDGPLWCWL